ncbi:hypothetical protein CEUSTIGMA_g3664.t1 [Chlamydomonas eustigma]|uniref:Uncharacterized protein n=1 Tax=Chlamydomonas eustigma TaxID=1157962 RepID=A0A250X0D3_9CHLO|nr:hypothetical protein CEUSTIGMA_g3664.t1 [Chlamydomonas eustigma]|eukprot:GAX76220.1 hypothetical protein CEUSTIGMA_g3664.t1 [Chlamydomonas eustigma]
MLPRLLPCISSFNTTGAFASLLAISNSRRSLYKRLSTRAAQEKSAPQLIVTTEEVPRSRRDAFKLWEAEGAELLRKVCGDDAVKIHRFPGRQADDNDCFHDTNVIIFENSVVANRWIQSSERENWMKHAEQFKLQRLLSTAQVKLDDGSLGGWIAPVSQPPLSPPKPPPAKWKMVFIIYVALLPTISLTSSMVMPAVYSAIPALKALPACLKLGLSLLLTVTLNTYISMGISHKYMAFLMPPIHSSMQRILVIGRLAAICSALLVLAGFAAGDLSVFEIVSRVLGSIS